MEKLYEVEVTAWGRATISAPTKAEARRRADRGQFDTVRMRPPSPKVSTIREKA